MANMALHLPKNWEIIDGGQPFSIDHLLTEFPMAYLKERTTRSPPSITYAIPASDALRTPQQLDAFVAQHYQKQDTLLWCPLRDVPTQRSYRFETPEATYWFQFEGVYNV